MPKRELQIVAFNNPNPPDYGGAIDLFYRIKALSEIGVDIVLHIYYDDRTDISLLEPFCKDITLYKRQKNLLKYFSVTPYSIKTRFSNKLIENLSKSEGPILFESIVTTGVLKKKKYNQKVAVRCHNIEHVYTWGLFKSEYNWFKKAAFFFEGYKLKHYESILNRVDILFPLSYYECNYFDKKFSNKTVFLPVFQESQTLRGENGFGEYALYHGDLSISDNIKSALFIAQIFKGLNYSLIIASSTNNSFLNSYIEKYDNIAFQLIESENQLKKLIRGAHINTLYSFQKSGTKLKVFNALFNGRHCIVNKNMIDDPDVLNVCVQAEELQQYRNVVERLFKTNYIISEKRINALKKYQVRQNAQILIDALF